MDALALLCTLHADGPATLVRLRAADCATLEDVIGANPDELALLLRSSLLSAGRFQKEAHQLRDRLVIPVEALSTASSGTETRLRAPKRQSSPPPPTEPAVARPAAIDRVLAAWRDADAAEVPVEAADSTAQPASIAIAAVDGIDAETSRALAQAGVRDLSALASSDALTMSRATGLSYSKMVRLRALARRQVTAASAPATQPPLERISPAERPVAHSVPLLRFDRDFVLEPEPTEEGVGGPFA